MRDLRSTVSLKGHPVHPMLVPFPIALFIGALATDAAFLADGASGWAAASKWLLGAGLVGALLAAAAGFTDFAASKAIREFRDAWLHMFANLAAVAVEALNFALRLADEDAAASIGLALSAVAALLLLFSGWKGGELVFRHGVGQARKEPGS